MREREGRWKEAEKERVSLCERTKGRENDMKNSHWIYEGQRGRWEQERKVTKRKERECKGDTEQQQYSETFGFASSANSWIKTANKTT